MPAKDSKTILVRVPAEIVEAAVKLKKEENLPTIGNAIRYWFEQQKDERIQLELSDIKVKLEEMAKNYVGIEDNIRMLSMILFRLSEGFYKPKALKEFLEEEKSKYAPILKALEKYAEEEPKEKHLT